MFFKKPSTDWSRLKPGINWGHEPDHQKQLDDVPWNYSPNISMVFNILWHFHDLLWGIVQGEGLLYPMIITLYPRENERHKAGVLGWVSYCISEPIGWMLISAICMGLHSSPPPYLTYHSIHVSSILRAAVAETSTHHWSQWCNEVQWAGNYSTLPRSSNIRLAVITVRSQWKGKKWSFMLFKRCHQKWVCKDRNGRGPSPQMLSSIPKWLTVGAERPPLIYLLPVT